MSKLKAITEEAKKLAGFAETWADLSNALFDPMDGLVAKTFATPGERATFRKTKVYGELHGLVEAKMRETGVVTGANPKKSGRFVVRLPRSLHTALESEAQSEGISLNQLVLAKLAVQLENATRSGVSKIIQAFVETRDGYSADKVVVDPSLDKKFLRRCRELGLAGTDFDLNWWLLNARKTGELSYVTELMKTKRFSLGKIADEFEYASELAVRFLQQTQAASLDKVICDPDLAAEFDQYAMRLAPGYRPVEYRWAALGLRKAGRLGKIADRDDLVPEFTPLGKVSSLQLQRVPEVGGIYLFASTDESVFLGQTDNLRHRLEKHLQVSNARGLPEWLWDVDNKPLQIQVASLPDVGRGIRQAIEALLLRQWMPVLNFPRKAA